MKKRIENWPVFVGLAVIHIGALAVFLPGMITWSGIAVMLVLVYVTGALGVTLNYHRTLTHRSLRMVKPLEYLTALFATLSLQGGPIEWVATHRAHHAHSDKDGDPHNSNEGFRWSHLTWLYLANKAILTREQKLRMAHDVASDKFYVFIDKYQLLLQAGLAVLLYMLGGASWVVLGIFMRLVLTYHLTWLINSAAHSVGYQTFKTGDRSTNCWWLALMSWGEGWHNNHHAFPFSARHGLRWFEIDHTWHVIKLLKSMRLASNIKVPTLQMQQRLLAD
ncbi:MAG: fatty acid desaturase [Candidatus Eremiobacteraeota bacterium]|nr:fatty acid desaturase [Candidatus Eremiobacteraeota bacterium]